MEKMKPEANLRNPKVISLQMDAAFFFERAVQSMDRFHYDKALKYFRKALEYEPDNPVNHCNMAGIYSELGNYTESNNILRLIIEEIDPTMTECYFYMANNYANMEDFESAEVALVHYLEHDPAGQFLEESEEMIELLSYELDRPTKLKNIKSREGLFEHDRARALLEEGKFAKAIRVLERLVKRHPEFLAARNNLALAYYYMGNFDKSWGTINKVLELDPGNLHGLCNLAIFYQHSEEQEKLEELTALLCKTYPFQQEHVFKLATTMGILKQHETAYRNFCRLLKSDEVNSDPCLYHYTAVAAYNTGRYKDAGKLWRQAGKIDPASEIPRFYLSQLNEIDFYNHTGTRAPISYHYHLPYEEPFRVLEKSNEGMTEQIKQDPLVRSSFFWALHHGDRDTKLQVIQAFGMMKDREVEEALRKFLTNPKEDDYLKKVAIFVLRCMGERGPLPAILEGRNMEIHSSQLSPNLPVWEDKWQTIMEMALRSLSKRYDIVQQHDLQTLWVEFLTRAYPHAPKIHKPEGWAAALEYLTAKMHRRAISYEELSRRYGISINTISKHVKVIDKTCGLREKMNAIFPQFSEKL